MLPRAGLFGLAQLFSLAAGLALQSLVARRLGAADYGRFVTVQSVLLVALVLLMSAVPNALRRRVSFDPGSLPAAWRMLWLVQAPLALGLAALLSCLATPVAAIFDDGALGPALSFVAIELAIRGGLLEPAWHLLNGLQRHATQAALMILHTALRVACVGGILVVTAGLLQAVVGLALAAAVSSLAVLAPLMAAKKAMPQRTHAALGPELWQWLRLSPAADILNYLAVAVNLWIVKAIVSDQQLVGAYAACYTLVHVVLSIGIVLSRSYFSAFAQAIVRGDKTEARALVRQPLRLVAVLTGLGAAVAVEHGETLTATIFGPTFAVPGLLLAVAGTGMAELVVVWFLADMLAAAGRLHARLGVGIGTFAASLSATLLLTESFGIWGAACGLLVGGGCGCVAVALVFGRLLSGVVPWATAIRAACAAVLVVLLGEALPHVLPAPPAVVGIATSATAYSILVVLMGESLTTKSARGARRRAGGFSSVIPASLGAKPHE